MARDAVRMGGVWSVCRLSAALRRVGFQFGGEGVSVCDGVGVVRVRSLVVSGSAIGSAVPKLHRTRGISRGDVVLAPLPTGNATKFKTRPVLVLGSDGPDLHVLQVTKRPWADTFDVRLFRWRESGLRLPSTVRCSKNYCIPRTAVKATWGRITKKDLLRVVDVSIAWFTHLVIPAPSY